MNTLEKMFYKIGLLTEEDYKLINTPDDTPSTAPIRNADTVNGVPIFNYKTIDGDELLNIISIAQNHNFELKNFGCSNGKITRVYNPKICNLVKERSNKAFLIIKVLCNDSSDNERKMTTKHVFYTLDCLEHVIKVVIETYCTFICADDTNDNFAMDINSFFARSVIKNSNIKKISPSELQIPISYEAMDVINKKRVSGYVHVYGDEQVFIEDKCEENEPEIQFNGHFDDTVPTSYENIDLSDVEKEIETSSKIISITDVINRRKDVSGK